ncbi:GntR family transcriptional regulator [Ancylobacter sp. TS-1]|uniref:GntR family transcriptional regulator n=1 Tax=Ancylobacter sp. TS-1 TaxID=1850374 RepID=UPI001265CC10|nr:GntR family transcriptional regulator [Ancylobacter sp. TS-1]QFR33796.1 FCD domain-containing protein [Ancylobacter sp. TS-1]
MSAQRLAAIGAETSSAADWAFYELWRRIVRRDLAPGARVTEETLAKELDVSRTPLRDAIRKLEEYRLLSRHRNRTIYVAPMSVAEVLELTAIREQLEALVVRLAAQRASQCPGDVAKALLMVEQMSALEGTDFGAGTLLELGDRFHEQLVAISGMPRLGAMLTSLRFSIERYRYLLNETDDRSRTIAGEHRRVIEAIAAGDADGAEVEMRAHIGKARELYVRSVARLLDETTSVARPGSEPGLSVVPGVQPGIG